ncbi:MAG: hypothetical protein H7838_01110 [Magnetococcus sp. DMHC-8]
MEELQVCQARRHGNGLLDRMAARTTTATPHAPMLHVRNRWSSLKPGFSAHANRISTDLRSERAGV